MRGGRPSLLAAGAALVLAVLALALVLVPVGPSSVRRSRAPRSRLGLHGRNAASADAASPTRGLIKDAIEAELLFVADALQTGVGLLGREVGGRIGSSDYQAAALQAGASRTAYAPARCLIAKSFAFAGGSAVILSAVHPLAEAIASASPSASVTYCQRP